MVFVFYFILNIKPSVSKIYKFELKTCALISLLQSVGVNKSILLLCAFLLQQKVHLNTFLIVSYHTTLAQRLHSMWGFNT